MLAYALVVVVILAGQLRSPDERYSPGAGGQPPAGGVPAVGSNPANPAEQPAGSGLLPLKAPFGDPTPPANSGGATNGAAINSPPAATGGSGFPATSGAAPAGAATNPLRGSPGGATPPRAFEPLNSRSAVPLNGQSAVVPAANEGPASPYGSAIAPPPADGAMKPSAMMRAMLVPPNGSQLSGQPIKLVDLVASARSRAEQSQRIDAYWDLCSSVVDYYLGLRELQEVQGYARINGQFWDQVYKDMSFRTSTSLRAARAAQMRVASLMGLGGDYLPLPEDAPHCASYNTHHDKIFAGGGSAEARELDALLPLRYAELQSAAADVKNSEKYLDSFASGRGSPTEGLNALELLALHRRAFVQIARDYNRRISRYSELASPGEVGAVRLTSMLIKTNPASTATRPTAPAPPGNRQSLNEAAPPRTFAEGAAAAASPISVAADRDEKVQAAAASEPVSPTNSTSKKERSLLVAPK